MGASVPTTKAGPVLVAGETVEPPEVPLLHPATSHAAAASATSATGKDLICVLEITGNPSLSGELTLVCARKA
jgi:hypothetical protein